DVMSTRRVFASLICTVLSGVPSIVSCCCSLFIIMIRPLPRSTLFPYTTLFRSLGEARRVAAGGARAAPRQSRSCAVRAARRSRRSEEHTSELQSPDHLVCRLLLEKKKRTRAVRTEPS